MSAAPWPGDRELIVGGGFQGAGFLSKISFIQDQQNQVPGQVDQSAFKHFKRI